MGLLVLGIIIALGGYIAGKTTVQLQRLIKPIVSLGIIVAAIGLLTACMIQVDAGFIGVQKLFGKIQPRVLSSGLHLINPLVEVIEVDTRTQNYTMSGMQDESRAQADDAIHVLSADGLEVVIDLTVLYRVIASDAPRLIKEVGMDYKDKIVRPITRTHIRDNAVYYDAVDLYSTKRDDFQNRITKTIDYEFKRRGLMLENLLVRNITLPASVKQAIEQKINAEQESQKMQFVLAKEKQEADRKRVEAQGIADYQRIINENLTDKQLQYEQIKAIKDLAASPNAKIIMMGSKGAPVILDTK